MAEAEGKFELVTDVGMTNSELTEAIASITKAMAESATYDISVYSRLSIHLDALLAVQLRRAQLVQLFADAETKDPRVNLTTYRVPEAPGRGGAGPSGETGHG